MTVTRHSPPPLVVRTTIAAFAVVAFVLSAVLAPGVISGTGSLRSTVSDSSAAPQRILPALGRWQSREPPAQVAMRLQNPTLRTAVDACRTEMGSVGRSACTGLLATTGRKQTTLADRIEQDAVAVSDPCRLTAARTPLLARIVHGADAFDAMMGARTNRPARAGPEAVRELRRCVGTQVDAELFQALFQALPIIGSSQSGDEPAVERATLDATRRSTVVGS